MIVLIGIAVFAASAALDFAIARYTIALRDGDAHRAGLWSMAGCLLSSVAVLAIVNRGAWIVAPEAIGFYVGTRAAGLTTRHATLPK